MNISIPSPFDKQPTNKSPSPLQKSKDFLLIDGGYLQNCLKHFQQKSNSIFDSSDKAIKNWLSLIKSLTNDTSSDLQRPQEGQQFMINCKRNQIQFDIRPLKQSKIIQCPHCQRNFNAPRVQAQVDVAIAMEIVKKVLFQNYTKLLLIAGDKDFTPVLELLREFKPEIKIWILGFSQGNSISCSLQSMANRNCVLFLDQYSHVFLKKRQSYSRNFQARQQQNPLVLQNHIHRDCSVSRKQFPHQQFNVYNRSQQVQHKQQPYNQKIIQNRSYQVNISNYNTQGNNQIQAQQQQNYQNQSKQIRSGKSNQQQIKTQFQQQQYSNCNPRQQITQPQLQYQLQKSLPQKQQFLPQYMPQQQGQMKQRSQSKGQNNNNTNGKYQQCKKKSIQQKPKRKTKKRKNKFQISKKIRKQNQKSKTQLNLKKRKKPSQKSDKPIIINSGTEPEKGQLDTAFNLIKEIELSMNMNPVSQVQKLTPFSQYSYSNKQQQFGRIFENNFPIVIQANNMNNRKDNFIKVQKEENTEFQEPKIHKFLKRKNQKEDEDNNILLGRMLED